MLVVALNDYVPRSFNALALHWLTNALYAYDVHAADTTEHKAFFAVAAALAPVTPCTPLSASNTVTGAVTGPQQAPAYTAKQIALLRKLSTALNIAPQLTAVLFASDSSSTEVIVTSATVKTETSEAALTVTDSNGAETAGTEDAATAAAAGSSSSSSDSDTSNKRKADEISTSNNDSSNNSSSNSSSKAIISNGDLTQVAKLLRKQLPSISLSE